MIKITDFGAEENRACTREIQSAIDACGDGDTLVIPKGTYISGALFLKGNMTLHFENDARLVGSEKLSEYPIFKYRWEGNEHNCYAALINVKDGKHKNIAITGNGVIDASGVELRKKELAENAAKPGRAVCIRNTDGVTLKDITIRQSPAWCLHLIYCNNIEMDGIIVNSKFDENGKEYENIINGDGIDIDSCCNVHIANCNITSEDDCIAIKSGRDAEGRAVGIPTKNVLVENCHFRNGFGVAVGSEMSGGVYDVAVKNCDYIDSFCVASVKTTRGRGGSVKNIHFENCTLVNRDERFKDCRWFRGAIYIDMLYSLTEYDTEIAEPITDETPEIDGVYLKDISVDTCGGRAVYICGLRERPLGKIYMENVSAVGKRSAFMENADDIVMKNVSFKVLNK